MEDSQLVIIRFEPSRGFCRALVEKQEDQQYSIVDWERIDIDA